jgi:hypothetical protein
MTATGNGPKGGTWGLSLGLASLKGGGLWKENAEGEMQNAKCRMQNEAEKSAWLFAFILHFAFCTLHLIYRLFPS